MIWETRFTDLTNTKYPLMMGAFGGWGKAEFASEFSKFGGLGIITALNFPNLDDFRENLIKMKSLTQNPFGVNLSLPHHGLEDSNEDQKIKQRYHKYVDTALEENVRIFSTSGYKAAFIGKKLHEAGAIWFHKCVLLKHAISAQELGADGVTLVGLEGTGFKNPLTQTTLINITMAKKLLNIPIIAAGGIGDARGFLGALMMGADAVCLGTALMSTKECPVSKNIKKKWLELDIFSKNVHKKIYKYSTKNFMAPSTAIAHQIQILPIKEYLRKLIIDSESIFKSYGFDINNIENRKKL
jgi:nitronate monooxygenase